MFRFSIGLVLLTCISLRAEIDSFFIIQEVPQLNLYYQACDGNIEGVSQALAAGADIDKVSSTGFNALHFAIAIGQGHVVRHLLENDADPDAYHGTRPSSPNALGLAAVFGQYETAEALLEYGADPSDHLQTNDKRMTPLAFAALYGRLELVKLFVRHGADPGEPILWPAWGRWPNQIPLLAIAAQHGGLEVVRYLVEEKNAAVTQPVIGVENDPLWVAAKYGNIEVAKYLIGKGAKVDAVCIDTGPSTSDYKYWKERSLSCLGVASRYGHRSMVELLLDSGARIPDGIEKILSHPILHADHNGYEEIVELFEAHGYSFDYWSVLRERDSFQESNDQKIFWQEEEIEGGNRFAVELLESSWKRDDVRSNNADTEKIRVAVIADERSGNLAALLEADLSTMEGISLVERSELDLILAEHTLSEANLVATNQIDLLANILDAQALVIIDAEKADRPVHKVRLVNVDYGFVYGVRYASSELRRMEGFLTAFTDDMRRMLQTYRLGIDELIPVSVLNVRADSGTIDGIAVARQLESFIAAYVAEHERFLLVEREEIENLLRESFIQKDIPAFLSSSVQIDARVDLDTDAKPQEVVLQMKSQSGAASEIRFSTHGMSMDQIAAEVSLSLSKWAGIEGNIDPENSFDLERDATAFYEEAKWLFKVGLKKDSLDSIKTSIGLGYDSLEIWALYLDVVRNMIDPVVGQGSPLRKRRGFDEGNRRLLELERERMTALEGYFRSYRIGLPAEKLKLRSGPNGNISEAIYDFTETLEHFRPVSMRRRYSAELEEIADRYLRIVETGFAQFNSVPEYHQNRAHRNPKVLDGFFPLPSLPAKDESALERARQALFDSYTEIPKMERIPTYSLLSLYNSLGGQEEEDEVLAALLDERLLYFYLKFAENIYRSDYNGWRTFEPSRSIQYRLDLWKSMQRVWLASDSAARGKMYFDHPKYPEKWNFLSGEVGLPMKPVRIGDRQRYRSKRYNESFLDFVEMDGLEYQIDPKFLTRPQILSRAAAMIDARLKENTLAGWKKEKAQENLTVIKKQLAQTLSVHRGNEDPEQKNELGILTVNVWRPSEHGYPEVGSYNRIAHPPIFKDGAWWVTLKLSFDRKGRDIARDGESRFVLFRIDPDTLKTDAVFFELEDMPGWWVNATMVGEWLAISHIGTPKEPVFVHRRTGETKVLKGYVPSRGREGYGAQGRYFCLMQESDAAEDRDIWYNNPYHMLVSFDPETEDKQIIFNTRRRPPENPLDIDRNHWLSYMPEEGLFYVDDRNRYCVESESLEVRATSKVERERISNQGTPGVTPGFTRKYFDFDGGRWRHLVNSEELIIKRKPNLRANAAIFEKFGLTLKQRRDVEMRKAVLIQPASAQRAEKFNQEFEKWKREDDWNNKWAVYGENYGYVMFSFDYGFDDSRGWRLGFFRMSDLFDALQETNSADRLDLNPSK